MNTWDKPIFNGLLHTGLPDLATLYKVPAIPLISRMKFAGWADKLGLPTEAWYDAFAANVNPASKIVLVDHEDWPYGTQADRQATAQKYVALYQGIKSRRPDLRIGWYMDPIRRDFWRAKEPIGSASYASWQADNNDLGAIMAPCTDVFMPSLYFYYNRDVNPLNMDALGLYLERNIAEAKRIRRVYGRMDSPIYPYVWWMRHDGTRTLDPDVWETIVRTTLEEADGMVLWGGWQVQWDEQAPWWITVKARLTDNRRTQ